MFAQRTMRLLMSATIIGLSAQAAQAITLSEAVDTAIKTHPEVRMSLQNREAIHQEWKQAVGGFKPTVDLLIGSGHERSNNPTTRTRADRNDKEGHRSLWRNEARLNVNQMLFDGYETDSETCEQKFRYESASHELFETKENVALRTVQAYLDVMRTKEILDLQKETVDIHLVYLKQMQKRSESGRGSQADVRQAQGRMALAEANLLSAAGDYRKAQISFNEIVGEKPKDLKPLDVPVKALPVSLENAVERAVANSPAIKSAKADIAAADKAVDVAKAAFYPRLDLELEATRQQNLDGTKGPNNEYSAMARMRYNLYRGGADTARTDERKARKTEAEDSLARDTRLVEENVYSSWNDLQTAKSRLAPLASHVTSADQTRGAYKKQFDIGQRSLLDVLDSEVEYVGAKSARINGKYAVDFAAYAILANEGSLVMALEKDIKKEPVAVKVAAK